MLSIFEMMIVSLSSVIQDCDDVPWSLSMFELKLSNDRVLINANQVPLKLFKHVIHFLAGIQDKYSQVADDIYSGIALWQENINFGGKTSLAAPIIDEWLCKLWEVQLTYVSSYFDT